MTRRARGCKYYTLKLASMNPKKTLPLVPSTGPSLGSRIRTCLEPSGGLRTPLALSSHGLGVQAALPGGPGDHPLRSWLARLCPGRETGRPESRAMDSPPISPTCLRTEKPKLPGPRLPRSCSSCKAVRQASPQHGWGRGLQGASLASCEASVCCSKV